jgi:hypothetical protein
MNEYKNSCSRANGRVFDALVAGTASIEHRQQLPDDIIIALKAGYEIGLGSSGDFIVYSKHLAQPNLVQTARDVKMMNAPLQTPHTSLYSRMCDASHSHTSGVCPIHWPASTGSLENLRHRLRLLYQEPQNSSRLRAFCAIKQRTVSCFGNSSSSLAHEIVQQDEVSEDRLHRKYQRKISLDSWKVARVWKRL